MKSGHYEREMTQRLEVTFDLRTKAENVEKQSEEGERARGGRPVDLTHGAGQQMVAHGARGSGSSRNRLVGRF